MFVGNIEIYKSVNQETIPLFKEINQDVPLKYWGTTDGSSTSVTIDSTTITIDSTDITIDAE
jgi:hypothetical protein